jgi:hypothetical protein
MKLRVRSTPNACQSEIVGRVVIGQTRFRGNVFDETNASWRKTKKGNQFRSARNQAMSQ